jgi:hypothetical protein
MSDPVSNDELDWLIWRHLRDHDRHPTTSRDLLRVATYSRIRCRMQTMRRAGRVLFWHFGPPPAHVRSHGWEVLGCPGAGIQEDGQFDWAYGCADCQRRVRPDPADGVVEPPPIVAFECELRIEP